MYSGTAAPTICDLLAARAAATPEDVYLVFNGRRLTVGGLARDVDAMVADLKAHGLTAGDRIFTMLPTNPGHVTLILASILLGLVSVPAGTRSKSTQLAYLLDNSLPRMVIYDPIYEDQITAAVAQAGCWRPDEVGPVASSHAGSMIYLGGGGEFGSSDDPVSGGLISIIYTSGTTGAPKGTLVTDLMLRVCAAGVATTTRPKTGDVFFQWEPLNHVGGTQILVLALQYRITIAMVDSFSASKFWDQVRGAGATHVHYLGGVLHILYKSAARPDDRDHRVRVAWGAGCTPEIWRGVENRFGIEIREVYGLTETSSINTLNDNGTVGSIGKPVPGFAVEVVDESGVVVEPGVTGEIRIRGSRPGMTTAVYFRNESATHALYREGWLYTSDQAWKDPTGHIYYVGRTTDSVRHRGENISAWEVERVVREHPQVAECALIGVPSELGEQELKLFVQPVLGELIDPGALLDWCGDRMPKHHVPRYVTLIDEFRRGPSMRIVKGALPRTTDDTSDREKGLESI